MTTTPNNTNVKEFYDAFDRKLINDYVGGNPRMLAALEFMKSEVEICGASRILDIGCGLGWSSQTLSTTKGVQSVLAVDLSSELIKTAQKLFGHPKIQFEQMDVTDSNSSLSRRFDAIIMLDVYEHISIAARPGFHQALDTLLSEKGFILLTCPTKDHQDYLRDHKPEGLQPVDEDVDLPDLEALAASLDARIDTYRLLTVWKSRDYLHAVIRRRSASPNQKFCRRSRWSRLRAKLRVRLFRRSK